MESLPSSIEAYLLEAGFSGTEIIILKTLLNDNGLTLRELAAKTGKSTGVLDQAVKKLLQKKIISRDFINETPKYVLNELTSITEWMREDISSKQEMMLRKHENFETYIRSLTVGKKRPDMEYFEGLDGIKRAYMQLLENGNSYVQYGPTVCLAEEDPLKDFRVQYFRERHKKGIFSRVITHNTVLGRRFQTRDPFEYRKTLLVEQDAYPFMFEKIISGNIVACFQLKEERACFIHYPELAEEERAFFERLWRKKVLAEEKKNQEALACKPLPEPPNSLKTITVPVKVDTFSIFRGFFTSKRSIAILLGFAVLSGALAYGFYRYSTYLNTKRIQERVKSIAATGALQFEADDINELRSAADIQKPQFAKVNYQLNLIRNQNPGLKYSYILRPTKEPATWEWVVDADSLDPYAKKDLNGDGVVNDADHLSPPGEPYDVTGQNIEEALFSPAASKEPYKDQWGTWISGWAPIKDKQGAAVAVFGVDMYASEVVNLSHTRLTSLYLFIAIFVLLIIVRLAVFNRFILAEMYEVCKSRRRVIFIISGGALALILTLSLYFYSVRQRIELIRTKVTSIAVTGALQFDAQQLNELHVLKDIKKSAYSKTVEELHNMRKDNELIKYAYLFRPFTGTTTFEFIADADAYGINLFEIKDMNKNGEIDLADETPYPGLPYDVAHIPLLAKGSYFTPTATEEPYSDKWGAVFTGYAPIKDEKGYVAAVLAIDMDAGNVYSPNFSVFIPLMMYLIISFGYIVYKGPGFKSSLLAELLKKYATRKVFMITAFIAMAIYWILFALFFYTLNILKNETGKRLMSIAVTAASEINAEDLEQLHFAKDMKKEEYQRVFNILNDIRKKNPDLKYVYIVRPTDQEYIWEFVADADSNYYIPFIGLDYDQNHIINEADENVAPGVRYDVARIPVFNEFGLTKAGYSVKIIGDQWGSTLDASSPILDKTGKSIAVLSVNKEFTKIVKEIFNKLY